jgi:glycosyltransferase involved in cell wall biosynthesis
MKVLMSFAHYPMCGGNFFKWAFEREGHEVYSVGPYSGDVVPWEGNPRFPKYVFPPDMAIAPTTAFPLQTVLEQMPWKPDLIFQVDAGFHLVGDSGDIPNALFATDPHFLDYSEQSKTVDFFFNPQPSTFMKYPKGIFLPWAYDPEVHFPNADAKQIYDVVFIGLMYDKRKESIDLLQRFCKVFARNAGIIYDECREYYNQGKIAFNWSSNDDIPMRIFEGMAYGNLMVTNRITGMELLFKEGKHYVGFDTIDELIDKIKYYLEHEDELFKIAECGYMEVEKHTYDNRVKQIIKEVFK